jgi:hypothetical protein
MRYTKHVERIAATALALCLSALPGSAQQPAPAPVLTLSARPELVGEGIVSASLSEFAPTLTPDGRTMIFAVTDVGFTRMTLMESRLVNGRWQAPTVLPFSGTWNDGDGALSPDGSRFLFISNRPVSGDTAKADLDLWEVSRTQDGKWGEPRRLPDSVNSNVNEVYPSIAADGTLYFGRAGVESPLYRSRLVGGIQQSPERLPFGGFSFAIAPDQSFAIVGVGDAARTNIDLHVVTFRDGTWGTLRRLDAPANSPAQDLAAWISGDARTLYFVSTRRGPAASWPRSRRVGTAAEVAAELRGVTHNGLRNIYRLDVGEIVDQVRSGALKE